MTREEAKQILLLYRPGTVDADDPEMAAALALAKQDQELAGWLAEHCDRQEKLRAKFRETTPPPGLLEQIVSEQAANDRMARNRRRFIQIAFATVMLMAAFLFANYRFNRAHTVDDNLAFFQKQMTDYALRGYLMDLQTNDSRQVRNYLRQHQSPSDYNLPPALKTVLVGCSVERWHSAKVSMVCFRTGNPLPPGVQSDLWLFVADQKAVKDSPTQSNPQISHINRLTAATWVKDGKLYFLGTTGGEETLRKFL